MLGIDYLAAALPGLSLISSPKYLIPFPLYGSGFLSAFTFAAYSPRYCLSIPFKVII